MGLVFYASCILSRCDNAQHDNNKAGFSFVRQQWVANSCSPQQGGQTHRRSQGRPGGEAAAFLDNGRREGAPWGDLGEESGPEGPPLSLREAAKRPNVPDKQARFGPVSTVFWRR